MRLETGIHSQMRMPGNQSNPDTVMLQTLASMERLAQQMDLSIGVHLPDESDATGKAKPANKSTLSACPSGCVIAACLMANSQNTSSP